MEVGAHVADRRVVGIDDAGPLAARRRPRGEGSHQTRMQLMQHAATVWPLWPAGSWMSEDVEFDWDRNSKIRARQSTRLLALYNATSGLYSLRPTVRP